MPRDLADLYVITRYTYKRGLAKFSFWSVGYILICIIIIGVYARTELEAFQFSNMKNVILIMLAHVPMCLTRENCSAEYSKYE